MDTTASIPSAADVRRLLAGIPLPRLRELAVTTGVPFGTLYKISVGETANPGIDTTRRFYAGALVLASLLRVNHPREQTSAAQDVAAGQFPAPQASQQGARDAA